MLTSPTSAERLGEGAIGLRPWEARTVKSATGEKLLITATPARHGPAGIEKLTGEVIGFVITLGNMLRYRTPKPTCRT